MTSKKGLLRGSRLYPVKKKVSLSNLSNGVYVILDRDFLGGKEILKIANRAILAGADLIQIRDKKASAAEFIKIAMAVKKITRRYNIPLIINDRLDVALATDADGIHIGQGDFSISMAKRLMGRGKLIGVSVKNFKQALMAKEGRTSYLGVGPVFKTPIKRHIKPKGFNLLNRIKKLNVPFFAIGGINCKNIHKLADRGFRKVAVIRAVCKARDPYSAVRKLKEALA